MENKTYKWAFVGLNECGPYKFEVVKLVDGNGAGMVGDAPKYELKGDTEGGFLQFRKRVDQCFDNVHDCFKSAMDRLDNEIAFHEDQLELLKEQRNRLEKDEFFWRKHDYAL